MEEQAWALHDEKTLLNVPLSVLDLSPIAVGGTAADALHRSLDLARHAEHWGFSRYWVAEHHNMDGIASAATAVVIGFLAQGTSTIRVGSGGVMLPNHSPLVIAEQFGTLESLYPGRIDLGIGRAPGTDPMTMRALRRDSRNQERDFPTLLDELRDYLSETDGGSPVARVRATPGWGLTVPIWLLGSSDFSAQLAAHLGLPFAFAGHFAAENTQLALGLYRAHFKPGPILERPYAMLGVTVIAADTDEKAQYLATTPMQKYLQIIRGRINSAQMVPPVENMAGLYWDEQEQAALEKRFATAVVGGPRTVQEKLSRLLETTQADELIIQSEIFNHAERLHCYEILSSLRMR